MRTLILTLILSLTFTLTIGCNELEQLESSVESDELADKAEDSFKAGDYPAARDCWLEAFELSPTDDELAFNISRAHTKLGDEKLALDWLQRSIKLAIEPRLDDTDLADLRESEEYSELRKVLNYAWGETDGDGYTQADMLGMEGFDLYLEGKYEEALELFERAFKLNQMEYRYPFNVACCYSLMGDSARCVEWMRKALHVRTREMMEDHDLDSIRQSDEFTALMEKLEDIWGR